MSETQRTDALKIPSEALLLCGQKGVEKKIVDAMLILGDHARQLEREAHQTRMDSAHDAKRLIDDKMNLIECMATKDVALKRLSEAAFEVMNLCDGYSKDEAWAAWQELSAAANVADELAFKTPSSKTPLPVIS